jgi:GNAT superfamily N-acetyltransferase
VEDAAAWLRTKGTDQWSRPWPDEKGRAERIEKGLVDHETWMVWDGATPAGTITINDKANRELWTPAELGEPALYVHRLIADRKYSGLGAWLLDWAGTQAAEADDRWIRVEVWTTNLALQDYYKRQGFEHVETRPLPNYPSGAIFQRKAYVTDFLPKALAEIGSREMCRERQGVEHTRTLDLDRYASDAIFQRKAYVTDFLPNELTEIGSGT